MQLQVLEAREKRLRIDIPEEILKSYDEVVKVVAILCLKLELLEISRIGRNDMEPRIVVAKLLGIDTVVDLDIDLRRRDLCQSKNA